MANSMEEYLVCEVSDSYGIELAHARRFTEEEKQQYSDDWKNYGFIKLNSIVELSSLCWHDINTFFENRNPDGSFKGYSNSVFIITGKEWDTLIDLNNQKFAEKQAKEKQETIKFYENIVSACERQGKLYTPAEATKKAKEWNDIQNEGREGYIPHFYTIDEYENAKSKLEELLK